MNTGHETAIDAATPLPAHLQEVLHQLLTANTDHAARKKLALSERTFSRRVSELLDNLGVATRFQAGVEAARRGWLGAGTGCPSG